MTKPAPTPPKPGWGGEAPATATERGRNRKPRPRRAFAPEVALRLAGALVVCPAIVLLADAERGPVALAETSRARQLRLDSSRAAGGGSTTKGKTDHRRQKA